MRREGVTFFVIAGSLTIEWDNPPADLLRAVPEGTRFASAKIAWNYLRPWLDCADDITSPWFLKERRERGKGKTI